MAGRQAASSASSAGAFRSGAALGAESGPAKEAEKEAGKEAGARPKRRGGRTVPSRYLDHLKGSGKAFDKSTTDPHDVLQSTPMEKHGRSLPELDVSDIKSRSCSKASTSRHYPRATPREKPSPVSADSDDLIRMLESETLLLTYANLKMEKRIACLEAHSEKNLLALGNEAARLQAEVEEKRRRLQRLRKEQELSESLDRQLEALGPIAEQCPAFEEEYRHFATGLDAARHELPMKEIYLDTDKSQYLDHLQKTLATTQEALCKGLPEHIRENAKGLSVAKELEATSLEVAAELPRTLADALDLSADVSKEASLCCQKVFEDTQGAERMKQLYSA